MNLMDLHCDTVWRLMDLGGNGDLWENDGAVSLKKLKNKGTVQFFACFLYLDSMKGTTKEAKYDEGYCHVLSMIRYLKEQVRIYGKEARFVLKPEELEMYGEDSRTGIVPTVEEGGILNGSLERLDHLYQEGVRLLTLMWNYENCLGFPNSKDPAVMERGLKPFGFQTVEKMNELGMVIDLSHASDGVFWDVLKYSRKPVAATHSNCRALADHPRNLSDSMLRALGEKGGVAGLNLYGPFLGRKKESCLEEMTEHLLHMIQIGGSDLPAIGTDFDGFDGMDHMDIPDAGAMERLWDAMKKKGVSEKQLDLIWAGNARRLWEENC